MSTTLSQARERIYLTFKEDWGTTSPFVFDGEKFKTPSPSSSWVRVSIRHNEGSQDSLGGVGARKFKRGGSVFIQCFTPLDRGRDASDTLADAARDIFEGKTLGTEAVTFTDVIIREIGPDEGWYQTNVEAIFNYTETK